MSTNGWDADGQRWRPAPSSRPDRRQMWERGLRAGGAVAAAAAVSVLAYGGLRLGLRDDQPGKAAGASASESGTVTDTPTWTAWTDSPTDDPTDDPTTYTPATQVPDGFHATADPAGFALQVPEDWTRTETSPQGVPVVKYEEPAGDPAGYVQIYPITESGYTPMRALESTDSELGEDSGYQQLRLEEDSSGAALLEYRITRSDGTVRHGLAQAFVAGDGKPYTVLVSGPDDRWDTTFQPIAETAAASFCAGFYCG